MTADDIEIEVTDESGAVTSEAVTEAKDADEETGPYPELSQRQRQVAIGLSLGETSKDLASKMGISQKTVDTHRQSLMKRLGVKSNVQLALLSVRRGYIQP